MKNGRYEEQERVVWYLNDMRHREDGPAIEEADGTNLWYANDQLHRENGPAVVLADGNKEWWINGEEISEEEFNYVLEKKILNDNLHSNLDPKSTQQRLKI